MSSLFHSFTVKGINYEFDYGKGYDVERHFQQYFSYMVAVSFIGGGNRRKPPTSHQSLTNFIT
jgi:hypothetical protein